MENVPEQIKTMINQQGWLEPVADQVQEGVREAYNSLGSPGKGIQNFLHGTWLGHPLHPVMTDIPIGAWTAAVLLDALETSTGKQKYGKGADVAVGLGLAGAAGAALTGVTDWQHLNGESRRFGLVHMLLNIGATVLFALSLFSRKGRRRAAGRSLALSGYGLTFLSAYLGGDLVFRQRIGTNHAPQDLKAPRFVDVMSVDDLQENKPTRAFLDGKPLVIVRRGEQVLALAETCAHLGGPLADGELLEDNSIVCPWHGSRFSLEDGSVLDGPSAFPQPCFTARIRNRRVEVRRMEHFEIAGEEG